MIATILDNETKHLIELCESYRQYVQLIKDPTRITANSRTLWKTSLMTFSRFPGNCCGNYPSWQ